jgi:hypothetical protein
MEDVYTETIITAPNSHTTTDSACLVARIRQQIQKFILSNALRKFSDCALKGNFSI